MSRIGEGKPIFQAAVLEQPPDQLIRQLLAFGNSAESSLATQTGPRSLIYTRTYWPTWYIVVAVVGFFLCVIGPLILLLNENETLSLTVEDGPRPGTSLLSVSGVAGPQVLGWLFAIMSQGEFVNPPGAFQPTQAGQVGSPASMNAAWGSADGAIPPGAPRSDDGYYWWDGSQWRPVGGPTD